MISVNTSFIKCIGIILPIARDPGVREKERKHKWYIHLLLKRKKKNPNVKARKERTCIFYKHTAFWKGKLSPRIHTLSSALFYKEGNYKDWGITTCCFTSNHQFIGRCCSVPAELMFLDMPLPLRHVHKLSKNNSRVVAHVT